MMARPAIDPVDKKNKAMPRWRVNQWLMMGVMATGLANARPTESSTPNDSRKPVAPWALMVHKVATSTMTTLASSTARVPRRAISQPASGIASP